MGDCWGRVRGETDVAQQVLDGVRGLDDVAQGVALGVGDYAGVAHLAEQLGDDIVVGLDLGGQQWRAQEVFYGIGDSV